MQTTLLLYNTPAVLWRFVNVTNCLTSVLSSHYPAWNALIVKLQTAPGRCALFQHCYQIITKFHKIIHFWIIHFLESFRDFVMNWWIKQVPNLRACQKWLKIFTMDVGFPAGGFFGKWLHPVRHPAFKFFYWPEIFWLQTKLVDR